jgi:aminopeptidase YwaD
MRRRAHLTFLFALVPAMLLPSSVFAQKPPLLPERDVAALAQELSGETAKRNLEGVVRFHRQRGSQGFHSAAELVAERARAYGLSDVAILAFPSDGKIFYGTQRSRPPWDAEYAELWEIKRGASTGSAAWMPAIKMASYDAEPVTLAEDSESADVNADLVDVGDGTKESDYAGKDVKGKIVLAGAQPGAIQDLAIGKFGAAAIVSYAQNQKTAWWGEDENLIRWGHLETFSPNKTFAFMVSLKTARAMRDRLSKGEQIRLQAMVKAGQHPGNLEVVTATIRGADPKLKDEEIAFSCHLDHQRPGANDNASGCMTILEVARTLQQLIANGQLARPARTIRFIWPPEIEGTLTLLNAKPEFAKRIKAVIHMDMVGGGPVTKSVFHVTRGPLSLPSFIHAVAWAFAQFLNEQSLQFASSGSAEFPLVAPEGGKEPLLAQDAPYTLGSDHDVYQDSSFGIPAIYFNDWPDRYIHTNFDSAANIDPTKLKRAAFIGAASGYFLATLTAQDPQRYSALLPVLSDDRNQQMAASFHRYTQLKGTERDSAMALNVRTLRQTYASASSFVPDTAATEAEFGLLARTPDRTPGTIEAPALAGDALLKFARKATPRGPITVFGYDFVNDHSGKVTRPKLLDYEGLWGAGEEYAYETLNFANGYRTAVDIRDQVSAEYGPVPLELILEYLQTLEEIGVVERVK